MENNNNGRGIFYGVIGVATLVVAIIGATFAYFSATAVSNNGVNVGTTTIDLKFIDEFRQSEKDLIPVDSTHTNFGLFPGKRENDEEFGQGTCRDLDGNAICSLYQFTVYNPSESVSQTVYGSIAVTQKSDELVNMSYALFKGSIEDLEGSFTVTGSGSTVAELGDNDGLVIPAKKFTTEKDDWSDETKVTLAPKGDITFTVVVWLEEAADANIPEAGGKSLTAEVTFDTGSGSGVTGRLDVAAD